MDCLIYKKTRTSKTIYHDSFNGTGPLRWEDILRQLEAAGIIDPQDIAQERPINNGIGEHRNVEPQPRYQWMA